jgi:hypothetical protein
LDFGLIIFRNGDLVYPFFTILILFGREGNSNSIDQDDDNIPPFLLEELNSSNPSAWVTYSSMFPVPKPTVYGNNISG